MCKLHKITQSGFRDLVTKQAQLRIKGEQLKKLIDEIKDGINQTEDIELNEIKRELSYVQDEQREIDYILRNSEISRNITEKGKTTAQSAIVGSVVHVENHKYKHTIQLVEYFETDPQKGKISINSPLGKAILTKKVGDKAIVNTPNGKIEYTIKSIY
ncbi:GreA/GreB family elongation factor [Candidatus Dojkabacteria bacterium]|nr:GreA/GreB family elongation factor [Candidatus Dojkabacteria bacterium]